MSSTILRSPGGALLRWAGGKQKLAKRLVALMPAPSAIGRYIEPFLGAASVFLEYRPATALLSDSNPALMEMYSAIRSNFRKVHRSLAALTEETSSERYYVIREQFKLGGAPELQAARMIYLNRLAFNGVYRVNQLGEYNVPYGKVERPRFPTLEHLGEISALLSHATLACKSFEEILSSAGSGDLVYLDPPYSPASVTRSFRHYTQERFCVFDYAMLVDEVLQLHRRGARFVLSVQDQLWIRREMADFRIRRFRVTRSVRAGPSKLPSAELAVSNF